MTFQGKIALVTGGTGDLGQVLVKRLFDEGLQVAFTYHSRGEVAQALIAECGDNGKVAAFKVDAPNLEGAREIVVKVKEHWGPVDYLVNNAGIIRDRSFLQMEEVDWKDVINVNLEGALAFSRAFIFDAMKRRQGSIVNVSSVAALAGAAGQVNYAAAKAGLLGMTKSLARETGRLGVRVNALAPGYIESKMIETIPERFRDRALSMIPVGRFGKPEEVAASIAFLLSDEADYINGQVLVVDGGLVM